MLVKLGYRVNLDLPLLSIKNEGDPDNEVVDEVEKGHLIRIKEF